MAFLLRMEKSDIADSQASKSNNTKAANVVAVIPEEASLSLVNCDAGICGSEKTCGADTAVTENNSKHPSRICGDKLCHRRLFSNRER